MSQRQAPHQREDDEPELASETDAAHSREEKDDSFDALIDEIDAIIEETGVIEYVQKGGQ
jgi:hypothetical protein